jgi:hypothetical protein
MGMGYFRRNVDKCCLGVGANNITYLPDTTKPLFSYFGTGILTGGFQGFHWKMLQGEAFWTNPALPVIGLPGIISGQSAMQPLIDTRSGINSI